MPFSILLVGLLLASILAVRSPRVRDWLLPGGQPSRRLAGASAVLLAALGWVFMNVLVFDDGDNAYLFLVLIGVVLMGVAVPFALAATLPDANMRRSLFLVGITLVVVVGGLSLALLASALIIIPGENYRSNKVFVAHLIGLLALVPTALVILGGHRLARPH